MTEIIQKQIAVIILNGFTPLAIRALADLGRLVPKENRVELFTEILILAWQSDQPREIEEPFLTLGDQFNSQDFVEVLKNPFCVGRSQAVVLKILEQKTGHQFRADLWQLVSQAKALGLDVDSPPIRSRVSKAPPQN